MFPASRDLASAFTSQGRQHGGRPIPRAQTVSFEMRKNSLSFSVVTVYVKFSYFSGAWTMHVILLITFLLIIDKQPSKTYSFYFLFFFFCVCFWNFLCNLPEITIKRCVLWQNQLTHWKWDRRATATRVACHTRVASHTKKKTSLRLHSRQTTLPATCWYHDQTSVRSMSSWNMIPEIMITCWFQ